MILKERDPAEHPEQDRLSVAGASAEQQMAFYLRRAFGKDPEILVLNDIRLKDDTGDTAQIDHLILHRFGIMVVESKSVTTEVRINENGEWIRIWNGQEHGMASPVQQAKRQGEFLKNNLRDHTEQLLGKMLGLLQRGFKYCPLDVLVAISDTGIVRRGMPTPEVLKADQVPDRIRSIIAEHKRAGSLFNPNINETKGNWTMDKADMERVSAFLLTCHAPLKPVPATKQPEPAQENPDPDWKCKPKPVTPQPPPLPQTARGKNTCSKCAGRTEITWGKYGYYWKCQACSTNIPIKEFCPACKGKMLLHKRGTKYFITCDPCKTESIYFEVKDDQHTP